MKPNPDCTGQQFGMLKVLGRGGKIPRKNSYRQLWRVECQCGKIIEIPRGSFEISGQVSCGCKRARGLVDNRRRPVDITGQRFGELVAVKLTGKKDSGHKPTWLLQCDCGNTREKSLSGIRNLVRFCARVNCGDRNQHPDKYFTYPATPSPYPKAAGELLTKYLTLTNLHYQKVNSAVEDEKRDRLIRAAWIVAYRRSCGEQISELHEARIIRKHLRYCSIDVFWKCKLENNSGLVFDVDYRKRSSVAGESFPLQTCVEIGSVMTDITPQNYPVLEIKAQGNNILSTSKRLKFKRC